MSELRLRKRARLKHKETRELVERIVAAVGAAPFGEEDPVESGEAEGLPLFVVKDEALALLHGEKPFPTVRGLLKMKGDLRRWVTVDMGAVKFVTNGADVMCPGIVECDPSIQPGDLVWVRDERNKRPLAVGEALMPGPEIVAQARAKAKGKAVKSLHHVGDKFWSLFAEAA